MREQTQEKQALPRHDESDVATIRSNIHHKNETFSPIFKQLQ
jgi:hypothetical protein